MAGKTKKEKTPSCIYEFRLLENQRDYKELLKMQNLGRILYNACLGEALRRMRLVKSDPLYKETMLLKNEKDKELRSSNFKHLNKKYGFTNASLQSFAVKCKNESKFIDRLGVHVVQKIATTAFQAVQKLSLGKCKRVHFKRAGEYISLEGKNNETFLRYSNGFALIDDLTIKCKLRPKDPYLQHFLKHRIKYCRLVSRQFKGRYKFFLQVVFEGKPYQKVQLGTLDTALDIGPSTIAKVNKSSATLNKFCDEIVYKDKEIKILQRKAARKLRLANPQNLNEKGAFKKGCKKWNRTNNYKKLMSEIADQQRRLAYRRKQLHGIEINKIVAESHHVRNEKLSYKAFQRLYGKSVLKCAPGSFVKRLENRITGLGGTFQDINTHKTRLSQTCICGSVKKKSLSERYHHCEVCGTTMQRDLFSAYLALFVSRGNSLNIKEAKRNYGDYEPILNKCITNLRETKMIEPHKINKSFGI